MSVQRLRWYHRLRITNAYGQLIALIFLPIMILSCVGASLVLMETARSSRSEQRNAAFAILARYQPTAQRLNLLLDQPQQMVTAAAFGHRGKRGRRRGAGLWGGRGRDR